MIGPKEKKERSLGEHLHLKGERCLSPKCAATRRPYRPGVHGQKRQRRGLSDFGRQIREKQKFKISYGVNERNLNQLFRVAEKRSGSVADKIVELLERRLDNVAFRLGLASSRSMARQLIAQGHIAVNKKRVRSPGFQVSAGDVIGFRAESKTKKIFTDLGERLKKYETPGWLHLDKDKLEGQVLSLPKGTATPFEVDLLVESFSK